MEFISSLILSVAIACLLVLVVILVRKRLAYFSSRGLPYSEPTWKLILFSFKHFMDYQTLMYKKERDSGHPIIGYFHTFLKPSLLVLDPSLIKEIYVAQFSHFRDRGIEIDFSREPYFGSLVNLKGDEWSAMRNRLMPAFSHGKLKEMIPDLTNCAESFINKINQDAKLRLDVNLKETFRKYSAAAYAKCVCGVEPESLIGPDSDFERLTGKMFNPTFAAKLRGFIVVALPKIAKLFDLKVFPKDVADFFISMTRDVLETRKRSGVRLNDHVQILVDLKQEGSIRLDHKQDNEQEGTIPQEKSSGSNSAAKKLEITDGLLAAQIAIFLTGGFDNTAYNVSLITYLLSKNKFIQQRLRKEVKEAKDRQRGLNYESLKEMKLLDAVISESLRMYPTSFFNFRSCTKDYTLSNGLKIEEGMQLFIPSKAMQNDGKYWANPEDFNPDRFLNDNYIEPGTYIPFGDGPRICQGYKISPLIAKIIVAELVDNFELLPSKKTKEPLKAVSLGTSEIEGGIWGSLVPLINQAI